MSVAGPTYTVTAADTAAALAANKLTDSYGRTMQGAIVECDLATGNAVRYAFGADPAVDTYHLLLPGQSIEIGTRSDCAKFKYINNVALSNAKLWITPKY